MINYVNHLNKSINALALIKFSLNSWFALLSTTTPEATEISEIFLKFNIIIRSILNYKNISEISVASGVVIDSNAKHEFNENFIKAKALIDLFKWFT